MPQDEKDGIFSEINYLEEEIQRLEEEFLEDLNSLRDKVKGTIQNLLKQSASLYQLVAEMDAEDEE